MLRAARLVRAHAPTPTARTLRPWSTAERASRARNASTAERQSVARAEEPQDRAVQDRHQRRTQSLLASLPPVARDASAMPTELRCDYSESSGWSGLPPAENRGNCGVSADLLMLVGAFIGVEIVWRVIAWSVSP
jgi:hypothetical protein